ncbi:class I SAM-dependent methyltransferase [Nocardiopsis sp. MG754419]|uniref:class I SAM-dependent methyltransferase n=1 Tax=Nocardiopsis sp. MG754419 TaxID=2259865 RepID=UPI001BA5ACDC|nr:class I SAM-dependent methyltransferase [Nocardiopsis sp. MG754419]MBR8743972.1 SAM-dependent methyltransferase [Nocardiopsis sp. MG754419]
MSSVSENPLPAFEPDWLALREEADAEARATAALDPLRAHLAERGTGPGTHPLRVVDLGCGTGSQGRWLAPRLPGAQTWVLYDIDPGLLSTAGARMPTRSADGAPVRSRMCLRDLGSITGRDLLDVDLVTGSALLDVLTRDALESVADAVTGAGCAALFTLSVTGRVELFPSDPADPPLTTAFNAHQRRGGRLGPDAVGVAEEMFRERGHRTLTFTSPWRLGHDRAPLGLAWLRGWVGAAREQEPAAAPHGYLERRLGACGRGELGVIVHHTDLLVLPEGATEHP